MITISDRAELWLETHPFHTSFMSRGLINASGLAREIRPELEKEAGEKLSLEAITLSLNRLGKKLAKQSPVNYDKYIGEVSVQSGVSALTIPQVNLDIDEFYEAMKAMHRNQEYSLYTRGVWHTALVGKREIIEKLARKFHHTVITHDLIAITVKLRPGHLPTPGVCGYILEKLAFNGINLEEVTSARDEMTVIIEERFMQAALKCLV